MRINLSKVLTVMMLTAFLVFGCVSGTSAEQITKTLTADTKLIPSGFLATDDPPTFKKGTTVTLNENGEVIEGTLAKDVILSCVPLVYEENGRHYFSPYKGWFNLGRKVTFNSRGEVIKGTIADGKPVYFKVPLNSRSFITLKDLTEVSFHQNGMMAYGTPWWDLYLKPIGSKQIMDNGMGGLVQFKGGRQIELNAKGEVLKGTINKDTKLMSPAGLKVYVAGTTVEFDDNGIVIKDVLKDEDRVDTSVVPGRIPW